MILKHSTRALEKHIKTGKTNRYEFVCVRRDFVLTRAGCTVGRRSKKLLNFLKKVLDKLL
jgi:hypothetical protein